MHYKAPLDSTLFLLRDVLKFDNELTEPILQEIAKLSEEVIAPTNQWGDEEGCLHHLTTLVRYFAPLFSRILAVMAVI